MSISVVTLDPIRIVMVRHTGAYAGVAEKFDQLFQWVETQSVPFERSIGLYWDNPEFVEETKLRSAAAIEIPADYQVMDSGGLPLILDLIKGGDYVTTTFTGPYEELEQAWSSLVAYAENTLRRKILDTPGFEVYVNDPAEVPPSQLITELYMPVA
jgi:AraC family transcriptional regulator